MSNNTSGRRRGAAGQQYAIVVGLIAVLALAATASVGGNVRLLLTNVANRMSNVQAGGGGTSGGGAYSGPPLASCKAILAAAPATPSGNQALLVAGQPRTAYCDMTTAGGGWSMYYVTDNYYHLGDSTGTATAYPGNGYSVDLRSMPFTEVLYIRLSDNAADWFSKDDTIPVTVTANLTSGTTLNTSGATFGDWTPHGGASTSPPKYELIMADKVWMQVGLMMSGQYTGGGCPAPGWKTPGNWCGDFTTNYYRINGEGNGVTDTGGQRGVCFREPGVTNCTNKLMAVGIR